jgi:serine/threonine protein kinase
MAVVYKAFDTRLERNVAIKVILPGKEHSEKFLKRFEREAKALAGLSHPNIVKVIDYGEHEGLPYLVMEYVPGGTLKHKLGKPMPWQEAARLLLPIARALGYAHESKIVHRDVKPSNILITQSGEPLLSDFGIAKILEAEETLDLTGTGVGVGTPEYMSPEQAQGEDIDGRSDLYSLGVLFYEMLTGRRPFQANTPYAVIIKHINEPLPRPREYQVELPGAVENVLIKILSKERQNRYQTMHEFVTALDTLIATGMAPATLLRAGKGRSAKVQSPRRIVTAFGLGFGGLVLLSLMILGVKYLSTVTPNAPTGATSSSLISTDQTTAHASLTPTPLTRQELLESWCGADSINKILIDYSIVFFSDLSVGTGGLESWGADMKISDGVVTTTGHNSWLSIGRADRVISGRGLLIRFRSLTSPNFHIFFEKPAYGEASHRWWGFSGYDNYLVPEAHSGAEFASITLDWTENNLQPTSEWLCGFLAVENTTFKTQIWSPEHPDEFAIVTKDMGTEWQDFEGLWAFASEQGSLDVDAFVEFMKK